MRMSQEGTEMAGWAVPKHGTFCWTEIASTDAEKCKAFYSEVFGWKFAESSASAGEFAYHEFSNGPDGTPIGGLYEIDPAFFGENPPPAHILTYVAVDNVDDNAKLAVELGGTIVRGPMDVPNVGRIAVLQDPTGAMFATFTMQEDGH